MKIRQFANLPGIETSLKIIAASSLAIGVVAGVAAAPAGAVLLTAPGNLSFNDGVLNTAGIINPVAGNTFTATFNNTGFNLVSVATGSFAPLFTPLGPKTVSSPSVNFLYASGQNYTLQSNLDFNFGTAGLLRIASGSTFLDTAQGATHSNFSLVGTAGSFITPDSIATPLTLSSFNFDVDNDVANPSPNGSYSLVASITPTAAVPEPFTVIGTLIGGTAAFRRRKTLASKN